MRPFTVVTSSAVVIDRDNIDTDVLIPIHRLVDHAPEQLGPFLFEPWRYRPDGTPDPTFPLNDPGAAGAQVLVAGANFGCGSSREHAVWALDASGFRAVIAAGFGDIFRQNCFQNGICPVVLAPDEVRRLMDEVADGGGQVRVDLEACTVTTPAGRTVGFEVEPERREALLAGLDDIGLTLRHRRVIEAHESADRAARPWIYRTTETEKMPMVLLLAGDGVGAEVMPEVARVIDWFASRRGLQVEVAEEPFGMRSWHERGTLMSDATWAAIEQADAIMFGAIGAPEYADLPAEARRTDWLLEMRRRLDLYENLRPVRAIEALADASTLRPEVVRGVDMVIVRELTGGVYFGEPRGVHHDPDGGEVAVNTIVYRTHEVERIARSAFELARTRSGRVCSVDKANVLEFGAFWRRVVQDVHDRDYPDVELSHMYVDNCAMQLVRDPRQFDVIVTENLFGDILSDAAAMITGSLGMLPSASLGPPRPDGGRPALYEPIHGSAPDIAGQGIANPLGALGSFAMCLRHSLGRPQDAAALERAITSAVTAGVRTRDLARAGDTPVSTSGMTDAVLAELDRITTLEGPDA